MSDADQDNGDPGNPVWTNQETLFPKYFELGMGPRERGIHYSLAMLCCAQKNYVIASDLKSLCDLLNTWDKSGDKVSIEEMQTLHPKLAHFFVETGDGKWTVSPAYFVINDPSRELS